MLLTSQLTFQATSNTLYRIAIDGCHGFLGTVLLRWGPPMHISSTSLDAALILSVIGAPSDEYAFERSPDLNAWTLWKRALNTNGSLRLQTPIALSNQFYRFSLE